MTEQRSAAQSLYPNLPTQARPEREQQHAPTIAQAMYPSLAPQPPPNWHREDIALIQRASGSNIEIARRYGVSKQVVEQIRKLGR